MIIFAPFLAAITLCQIMVSWTCLRRYPTARVPATLLLIVSPFQFLMATFGQFVFDALYVQSSFDAFGDGFDSLFTTVFCVVLAVVVSALLSVWLALSVRRPGRTA
jgi:hypothetical protein